MRKAKSMLSNKDTSTGETKPTGGVNLPPMPSITLPPQVATVVEQNVKPVVDDAQRMAAQTSVSGRRAVSRGTMFLAFYLWLLSGVLILSWIAQRTQFFPGDMSITARLQKNRQRWLHDFFFSVS